MPVPGVKFAELTDEQIAALKAMEDAFGVYLLALQPSTLKLAELSNDQIDQLAGAEREMNVILLAYDKSSV